MTPSKMRVNSDPNISPIPVEEPPKEPAMTEPVAVFSDKKTVPTCQPANHRWGPASLDRKQRCLTCGKMRVKQLDNTTCDLDTLLEAVSNIAHVLEPFSDDDRVRILNAVRRLFQPGAGK